MSRPDPIRVLIVEDSPTVRELMRAILESDGEIEVVGEAEDGAKGVDLAIELRPDLVTMDVHMPVMGGTEATREIMRRAPMPIVIVTATAHQGEVAGSFDALATGAVALLEKPVSPLSPDFDRLSRELVTTVKTLAGVKVVRRWGRGDRDRSDGAPSSSDGWVVGIAASTGGPAALSDVLAGLDDAFPAPILVVQHIAPGFVAGLASWLSGRCRLRVEIAEDRASICPGTVYLAPDGAHLGLGSGRRIVLSDDGPIGGHRPSANHLFASLARTRGRSAIGVVLTGMGRDGVEGLGKLKSAGGKVLVQDRASSVVYGMNGEAERAGLADAVLPVRRIGDRLNAMVGAPV